MTDASNNLVTIIEPKNQTKPILKDRHPPLSEPVNPEPPLPELALGTNPTNQGLGVAYKTKKKLRTSKFVSKNS